ncbi:reverse transcriptase [Phytophthora megakarya]|uniref:Reverse transcriptase n=1 Tax=Phytophthora megakarya TaxID=4795 RepID=A0A225W4F4_9STRA|nr:reverse transcriptase [Phytophthora megakarya]
MYEQDLDQRNWDEYAERPIIPQENGSEVKSLSTCYMVGVLDLPLKRWRYHIQKYYRQTREHDNQRLRQAIADQTDTHNDLREEYAMKLAHLWHGQFRVAEKIGEYAVKLDVARSAYSIFPDAARFDFDETLVPGDSWVQDRDPDEYEVYKISHMRTGKKTRYGRIYRACLVEKQDRHKITYNLVPSEDLCEVNQYECE